MSQNIQMEAGLLLASIGTGIGLMMVYDGLRFIRIVLPHSWLVIGIEDFMYWMMAGFVTFYLLYRENDGNIRMYVIGTVLLAMIGYDRLFSQFFLKVLKKTDRWIRIRILKGNRRLHGKRLVRCDECTKKTKTKKRSVE